MSLLGTHRDLPTTTAIQRLNVHQLRMPYVEPVETEHAKYPK